MPSDRRFELFIAAQEIEARTSKLVLWLFWLDNPGSWLVSQALSKRHDAQVDLEMAPGLAHLPDATHQVTSAAFSPNREMGRGPCTGRVGPVPKWQQRWLCTCSVRSCYR